MSQPERESAEAQYLAAFERLRTGRTVQLPKGTPVSQNNVAREAGRDPTALRKNRYPDLIREIKQWTEDNPGDTRPSPTSLVEAARRRNRELKQDKVDMKVQYDAMVSDLQSAREKIIELTHEVARLKKELGADNVVQWPHGK